MARTNGVPLKVFGEHKNLLTWIIWNIAFPIIPIFLLGVYASCRLNLDKGREVLEQGDLLLFSTILVLVASWELNSVDKLMTAYSKKSNLDVWSSVLVLFGLAFAICYAWNVAEARITVPKPSLSIWCPLAIAAMIAAIGISIYTMARSIRALKSSS